MNNSQLTRTDAGGAANQGGANYQSRVAAWYGIRMIAGSTAEPMFGLPAQTRYTFVRCQTESPVDDILVSTSDDGFLFIQAKKRIASIGRGFDSSFGQAIDQFVKQFIAMQYENRSMDWIRPLDPKKDRLILATGSESTKTLTRTIPILLNRYKESQKHKNILEAATNKAESTIAKKLEQIIHKIWKRHTGSTPSEQDLSILYGSIRIHIIDLEQNERDSRDARDMLRSQILKEPVQADAAWSVTVEIASQCHEKRSGFNASFLAEELRRREFVLNSPIEFRSQIDILKKTSSIHLEDAKRFSELLKGKSDTGIERDANKHLLKAVEDGHLLVVGEPGSGKSGLLYQLAQKLNEQEAIVIFLSVQDIAVTSSVDFNRVLGISDKHNFTEILTNWFDSNRGFIIFDALDAARSALTQSLLRKKINEIIKYATRWTVVASVREYDLRHGEMWQEMFRGKFYDGLGLDEFSGVRHIYLKRLSSNELERVVTVVPTLSKILSNSSDRLRDLLRNIFNLHLMAELVSELPEPENLLGIEYQVELLDRFWRLRVHGDGTHRDTREITISSLLKCMIESRSIRADRQDVLHCFQNADLSDLEKTGILRSPSTHRASGGDVLIFAHHILFDYAIERLTFRRGRSPGELVNLIRKEPDLSLMLGPSFALCFEDSWIEDPPNRSGFWKLALTLGTSNDVPEITKLHAPATVAYYASNINDLDPLLKYIKDDHEGIGSFLWHLVCALLVKIDTGNQIVGEVGGPWSEFASRLSEFVRANNIFSLRILVWKITQNPKLLTKEQYHFAGISLRQLLKNAWDLSMRDGGIIITAIDAVCDTFSSDPKSSVKLIQKAFEIEHLKNFGYEELPRLAHKVSRLMNSDPKLVVDLYRAAFDYDEQSNEVVRLGNSVLLGLHSNRQQDYRHSWWALSEAFPKFIDLHPIDGTIAIIRATEGFFKREKAESFGVYEDKTFYIDNKKARIREDHSYIWAPQIGGRDPHNDIGRMLSKFLDFLGKLAEKSNAKIIFSRLVQVIVDENELAVFWAYLLHAAAEHPEPFAQELSKIAASTPILMMPDTRYAIARYLENSYEYLNKDEREKIELSIIQLPKKSEKEQRDRYELIGYLPDLKIVTNEALQLRKYAEDKKYVTKSHPLFKFESGWGPGHDFLDELAEEGIDVKNVVN